MPRRSQSGGGCGAGCLGLLILFAIVGRGCDPGTTVSAPTSYTNSSYSSSQYSPAGDSLVRLYAFGRLNIRSGPGGDFPVVRTLSRGDAIEVGAADDRGWARVGGAYSDEYVYRGGRTLRSEPPSSAEPKPPRKRPGAAEAEVNPTGATARCRDGSLSYSAHRRGTCSHHGGVAAWY